MALPLETVETEALQLSAGERAILVDRLIASIDFDPEVEAAWAVEVDRREADLNSGAVALLSGPEALAKLRAEFR